MALRRKNTRGKFSQALPDRGLPPRRCPNFAANLAPHFAKGQRPDPAWAAAREARIALYARRAEAGRPLFGGACG